MSEDGPVVRCGTRAEWRAWLADHFRTEPRVWFATPLKARGMSYNDAVEEALCFGWIDSTARTVGAERWQRFTPRRPGSPYSQPNRERLARLAELGLIHESVRAEAARVLAEPFVWPADVLDIIRTDDLAWAHYETFSEPYRRIRVAFIAAARNRPDEFARRLDHFLAATRAGKLIRGYGGIDAYY